MKFTGKYHRGGSPSWALNSPSKEDLRALAAKAAKDEAPIRKMGEDEKRANFEKPRKANAKSRAMTLSRLNVSKTPRHYRIKIKR